MKSLCLAFTFFAIASPAQSATLASAQDPDAETRAAVLHALSVLKIAPYLSLEQPKPKKDATRDKEYRIGMVGTDLVTTVAPDHLLGKKVGDANARVITVPLEQAITGGKGADYDLLYIAVSVDADAIKQIVASHADRPIPLVCQRPGFANMGGGVQLFVKDNGIRFEINGDTFRRQGVRVDPQLRKLSRKGPV